jgi:hypothetical protein
LIRCKTSHPPTPPSLIITHPTLTLGWSIVPPQHFGGIRAVSAPRRVLWNDQIGVTSCSCVKKVTLASVRTSACTRCPPWGW